MPYKKINALIILLLVSAPFFSQQLTTVGEGWANNSINVTVFRKNSIVSFGNVQFTAYYDQEGYMVLGKRKITSKKWETKRTQYKGNVNDAHNSISIMIDGSGYLHASWDHHGHPLNYARSVSPYSLDLGEKQKMTGEKETNVTYPEFFRLPDGNLIFMYREGASGRGNLVLNRYDRKTQQWTQIQQNLIDGENQRNAYWQACVDNKGTIHVSWVWRESWLVETNHDLCYARSEDGGKTWSDSNGNIYTLPIKASTAEYAANIPQNSELINQTSMTADDDGNVYIATYWRDQNSDIPQYHIVSKINKEWRTLNLNFRNSPFSLKGGGTKRIPVSRPQVIAEKNKKETSLYLIFRDEERGSKASVASCKNINNPQWQISDLTTFFVGSWEPSYDTELWRHKGILHLFIQNAEQVDGEGKADIASQHVQILEMNKSEIKRLLK